MNNQGKPIDNKLPGPRKMEKNKKGQTFEEWMYLVDEAVEIKIGLSTLDLPDYDFYTAFEKGKSPATTAVKCIKNADDTY